MLVKLQLQKEFYTTQVKAIKLVKYTMVQQLWIGWNKSKKEVLQLHPQQQLVVGNFRQNKVKTYRNLKTFTLILFIASLKIFIGSSFVLDLIFSIAS